MTAIVTTPITLPIPTIPVGTGGTFTPGAAYAIQLNADIINATWDLASTKTTAFDAWVQSITAPGTGWLDLHPANPVSAGSISITAPVEPSMTLADVMPATVVNDWTTQAATAITAIYGKFSTFLSTYFPSEAAAYGAAESWLTTAITSTTNAVPAAIKAALLADGQAQILADQTRAQADNDEAWAARRHSLPTGAQQYQAMMIAQKAQDDVAALSRTIAVKDFDMSYQKAIEAVRMALSNRQTAMAAAHQYMQATVAGYAAGQGITEASHDAQTKMLSAVAQYFSSRVNAAELALKTTQSNQELQFEAAKVNLDKELKDIDNYLKVFLAQAQMLAHQVVSMLNNIRAGGNSQYSVSA